MKHINRILSVVLSVMTLVLFVTSRVEFGMLSLLLSIIFACFAILEEQKEEIERLRKKIMKNGLY